MDIQASFNLLEISPNATPAEIRQAYRDLISVWHPDRFSHNKRLRQKAGEKIKKYNEAYKIILNFRSTAKRRRTVVISKPTLCVKPRRLIAVASGKGGVGKTNFTLNVAVALKELHKKIMILDADLGMANIDVLCGVIPNYNLGDVLQQTKSIDDIIIEIVNGVKLIPGVSGLADITALNNEQHEFFLSELSRYESTDDTDLILIDVGAGMGPTVINFMLASRENIVIVTPEPTSIMDAYALIKTLAGRNIQIRIMIVVNMARDHAEAQKVFNAVNRITRTYLDIQLVYLGYLVFDRRVSQSVREQKPFFLKYPHSQIGVCIKQIASRMIDQKIEIKETGGFSTLINRISSLFVKSRTPNII